MKPVLPVQAPKMVSRTPQESALFYINCKIKSPAEGKHPLYEWLLVRILKRERPQRLRSDPPMVQRWGTENLGERGGPAACLRFLGRSDMGSRTQQPLSPPLDTPNLTAPLTQAELRGLQDGVWVRCASEFRWAKHYSAQMTTDSIFFTFQVKTTKLTNRLPVSAPEHVKSMEVITPILVRRKG